jgi:hypothetical protein
VPKQPEPYVVAFYCDPCARRSGRRRMLAVANRNPATYGGWDISATRRVGHVPSPKQKPVGNDGGVPHGDSPGAVATAPGKRLVLVSVPVLEPAAQLVCRRKVPEGERQHRPRVARAKLVELADKAEAVGRHDAYV